MNTAVLCDKCATPLPAGLFNLHELAGCPGCGELLEVVTFPALQQQIAPGRRGEALLEETESSCFYHPEKKAVLPCDGCGRFLCALCDCELNGQHFCPNCLDAGKTKGKIKSLENHRILYDSAALALAIVPIILFYFTFITAPLALFLAFRHWNTPTSIVHRTKIRFVFAILLAGMQVCGWVLGIGYLMTRHR